jgi:hypothetical protein
MERKQAYGIEELAKAGPLRRTYLYKAIKEKTLKAQKAGRRTIITHENFEAFLRSLPVVGEQGKAEGPCPGYEGEMCSECGNFTLVRNGTCMKCDTCGSTSGCS